MGTTFENEILEIFGTTDLEQLKKISRDVASYNQKKAEKYFRKKEFFYRDTSSRNGGIIQSGREYLRSCKKISGFTSDNL